MIFYKLPNIFSVTHYPFVQLVNQFNLYFNFTEIRGGSQNGKTPPKTVFLAVWQSLFRKLPRDCRVAPAGRSSQ